MEKYIIELLEKLDTLYVLYERYTWNHPDAKINVLIGDNTISVFLKDKDKLEEEFIITFPDEEAILYHYLSLEFLAIVLGNVYVHQDNNILFNNAHKPYVKMYVNDEAILSIMQPIINNQDKEFIHKNMYYLLKARALLFQNQNKVYDKEFLDALDLRINIVKKVLSR